MNKQTLGLANNSRQDSSFFDDDSASPQGSIRNQNQDQIS